MNMIVHCGGVRGQKAACNIRFVIGWGMRDWDVPDGGTGSGKAAWAAVMYSFNYQTPPVLCPLSMLSFSHFLIS